MLDITRDKPVKVSVKVAVPVRDHPKVSANRAQLSHTHCMTILLSLPLPSLSLSPYLSFSVQFRWQAAGPQGQLHETPAGGHNV